MRNKGSKWIPALASILLLLLLSVFLIVISLGLRSPVEPISVTDVLFALTLLAFPVVGWLMAVRRPQNPLGWLFLVIPLLIGLGATCDELALRAAQEDPDSSTALLLIAGAWFQFLGYWLLIGPAILLFPDGKITGDRFRWALRGLAAVVVVWGITYAISAETVCIVRFGEASSPCVQSAGNPLGFVANTTLKQATDALISVILMLTLVTSVTALVLRYLRSTGDVRQQIKWVAWVAAAGLLANLTIVIAEEMLGLIRNDWVEVLSFSLIALGLPIAIGLSIFKYRLYDIDRIISRTASYAVIITVLAAVYVLIVTLMQRLLPVQGQLGIVVSTLVVAALFNPLRWRVQNAVDRRFNRSRYDAKRVLDEFSNHLRDDVDLEQMQITLLSAAEETMQPSHLSLWVRERGRLTR